ncbi:hypothetical protein E5288_WYG015120 [Bos mutus]|uniref:Uncharacterized protein n=1 Tax=Bos mutus TaxID=72004 RepID=A0A6B0RP37_9CETA|nr:hypothetical protein [Bos mutus]
MNDTGQESDNICFAPIAAAPKSHISNTKVPDELRISQKDSHFGRSKTTRKMQLSEKKMHLDTGSDSPHVPPESISTSHVSTWNSPGAQVVSPGRVAVEQYEVNYRKQRKRAALRGFLLGSPGAPETASHILNAQAFRDPELQKNRIKSAQQKNGFIIQELLGKQGAPAKI